MPPPPFLSFLPSFLHLPSLLDLPRIFKILILPGFLGFFLYLFLLPFFKKKSFFYTLYFWDMHIKKEIAKKQHVNLWGI